MTVLVVCMVVEVAMSVGVPRLPVRISSAARCGPMTDGSQCVLPIPGGNPSPTKVIPSFASLRRARKIFSCCNFQFTNRQLSVMLALAFR